MVNQAVLQTFYIALSLMLKGMVGIFIFMVIFYLVVKILDKLFKVDPEEGVN